MRVFTVKLTDEERGHLEALRAKWGLRSEADAIRKMIEDAALNAGLVGNVAGEVRHISPGNALRLQVGPATATPGSHLKPVKGK